MRILIWIGALLPIVYALLRFSAEFQPEWLHGFFMYLEHFVPLTLSKFPNDPLKFLTNLSGNSAFWLLALTLTFTPVRVFLKLNLIRYRRTAGLFSFFYVLIHAMLFIGIDQEFHIHGVIHEVVTKPFIAYGMGAFIIMLTMALTSSKKLFGMFRTWHRMVYIAVVLIVVHYLMSHKTITWDNIAMGGVLISLLVLRLIKR
ncbi:ferric reductase-like transmembrane domain-containing protein [Sulfuricurvum sp.]|uniref:sulfite oxidase heme-binding subunit YedZ n=1 Tax=Sulfuricurvum sp. TaxID=2025608 RepID=UPI00261D8B1D|nr:ferric reductase-like transmembrane domain-containing protein [Sulfuricurvum sp.]MDD2265542.1 ferric reductase-like transmembrane domain-containing protein [Sulfuricurvum sp.]MDD2783209.1 ferric reductase-like transmembrane domain-containing protein [Sulfuricurvum sp.]